jgi:predicted transcriptional regulator
MATVTLSTRVPERLRDDVDQLAAALGRDRAWIVEQAVKRYIQDEAQFIAAVRAGIADADAGRVVSMEEIEAQLDAIDAKYEADR